MNHVTTMRNQPGRGQVRDRFADVDRDAVLCRSAVFYLLPHSNHAGPCIGSSVVCVVGLPFVARPRAGVPPCADGVLAAGSGIVFDRQIPAPLCPPLGALGIAASQPFSQAQSQAVVRNSGAAIRRIRRRIDRSCCRRRSVRLSRRARKHGDHTPAGLDLASLAGRSGRRAEPPGRRRSRRNEPQL